MFPATWFRRAIHSMAWSAFFLFAVFSLAAVSAWFVAPIIVADINPTGDASPSAFTALNDQLYFFANNGSSRQLYRAVYDGVKQVSDVYTTTTGVGCVGRSTNTPPFTVLGVLYFGVDTGGDCLPDEIWAAEQEGHSTLVAQLPGNIYYWVPQADAMLWMFVDAGGGKVGVWSGYGRPLIVGGGSQVYDYADVAYLGYAANSFYFTGYVDGFGLTNPAIISVNYGIVSSLDVSDASSTAVYQNDIFIATERGVLYRFHADTWRHEVVKDSGFDGVIRQIYVQGDYLYLIDHKDGQPQPSDTLWRYHIPSDTMDRIGAWPRILSLASLGDSAYFSTQASTDPAVLGGELLRLPLASSSPVPVSSAVTNDGDKHVAEIAADDALLYLRVQTSAGQELWHSDGLADTRRAATIIDQQKSASADPCLCFKVFRNTLYLDRQDPVRGVELHRVLRSSESADLFLPQVSAP